MEILCPVGDFTCPYCADKTWHCLMMEMDGCDPREGCDAFYGLDDDEDDSSL